MPANTNRIYKEIAIKGYLFFVGWVKFLQIEINCPIHLGAEAHIDASPSNLRTAKQVLPQRLFWFAKDVWLCDNLPKGAIAHTLFEGENRALCLYHCYQVHIDVNGWITQKVELFCKHQFARKWLKFVYNLQKTMYTVFAKLISRVKCYV